MMTSMHAMFLKKLHRTSLLSISDLSSLIGRLYGVAAIGGLREYSESSHASPSVA
jgi:hypothetical protein